MAFDNRDMGQRQSLTLAHCLRGEKGSKTRDCISRGMPAPVSATEIVAQGPSCCVPIVMVHFAEVPPSAMTLLMA